MRESPYPMISIEEAISRVLEQVNPLPTVTRHFDEAQGWVLAEEVVAREPLPPFRASTVDGFAVRAEEGAEKRQLVGEQFAGQMAALELRPGQAARITTGAAVPKGADAVMMVEWSREEEGYVSFDRTVSRGAHVRQIGSDITEGQRVLRAGTLLGPAEVGLLASTGITSVVVHKRPVVGVMSTGDELVEPEELPRPGQIRDSNRFSLMAAVRESGAEPLDLGIAPDTADALRAAVNTGVGRCDALLTSGGISMGELDLVKPLLADRGTIHFGRVNVKPGKPVTFATIDEKPFFAMPGNPVSSLVSFEIFVRPALYKMRGLAKGRWQRPRVPAVLEHEARHTAARTEFQRAILRYDRDRGQFYARTTGIQESSRLLSMVGANALIILPQGKGDFAAGEIVEAILLNAVGAATETS